LFLQALSRKLFTEFQTANQYITIMITDDEQRPDPDLLLHALKKEEEHSMRGKLKIFFGMCAGAGKTYEMLKAAHEALGNGINVVVGYVETHQRLETEALLKGLSLIPRKKMNYKDVNLEEMDIDAILVKKPELVLVDELAHTNAPGSRHLKRYQDVQEILDNGIDVYTTLNVQHIESRADTVAQITGSIIRETVPDSVFDQADDVEVIDIPPDELLKRLDEGKVYTPEQSRSAVQNFFRKGNLTALREMALRLTAERVDHQLRDYMQSQRITGTWKSGQRVLVSISSSPSSVSLIRWARRMAYTMKASWIAVYVETSKPLSDSAKAQLIGNIKLARELGAETITTADENVAQALVRVAHQQNATQILIGKTRRRIPFAQTLLDKLIDLSGDLDVYVVGEHDEKLTPHKRFFIPEIHSGIVQYAVAAATVFFAAMVCYPFAPHVGYQTVSLILLLIVALLPLKLGTGPVLLAATMSALMWDYFFIPPQFTFVIEKPHDILMLISYFAIAIVTGVLTTRIRAQEKAVRQREENAMALYSLTKDLSVAKTQDEVAKAAVKNISKFFLSDVVIFLSESDGDIFKQAHPSSTVKVSEKEFGVAAWVYWNEKKAGRFSDTLPSAEGIYFPISGPRYPLGVIGIQPKNNKPMSFDQESLLQNFISQIASTLEREQLNEMTKKSIASIESERLYKTLFNSISHELRTPIAAIMNASEGLLAPNDGTKGANNGMREGLAQEIYTAAERLNRLVENLLDMTRLESGHVALKLDWCDVNDLVHSSLRKVQNELIGHQVQVHVPDALPLVKMDFALIEQVLTNLLHNASQYTPAGTAIRIRADVEAGHLVLIVSDNGPGFPKEALPKVFEKFYRVPGSRSGGTGLGLSIARGFVEAHRGTITVSNSMHGGAEFVIRLPLESHMPTLND
jgi:two-component system, OmpR family, sensor histidine kinase KdpD